MFGPREHAFKARMHAHRTWDAPEARAARLRAIERATRDPAEDAVDPERQLAPQQRLAMADSARIAKHAWLTYWSSRARSPVSRADRLT
jgi:hypothetical protein